MLIILLVVFRFFYGPFSFLSFFCSVPLRYGDYLQFYIWIPSPFHECIYHKFWFLVTMKFIYICMCIYIYECIYNLYIHDYFRLLISKFKCILTALYFYSSKFTILTLYYSSLSFVYPFTIYCEYS